MAEAFAGFEDVDHSVFVDELQRPFERNIEGVRRRSVFEQDRLASCDALRRRGRDNRRELGVSEPAERGVAPEEGSDVVHETLGLSQSRPQPLVTVLPTCQVPPVTSSIARSQGGGDV